MYHHVKTFSKKSLEQIIKTLHIFGKKKKILWPPFLWMGSNCLKVRATSRSLLLTTNFPEIPGTHFIKLGRMKGCVNLEATQWFWTQNRWIGNPAPYVPDPYAPKLNPYLPYASQKEFFWGTISGSFWCSKDASTLKCGLRNVGSTKTNT